MAGIDMSDVMNDEILCVDKFIGDENCSKFCKRLSNNEVNDNRVQRLILRGNCLSTRSAQSIGEMLKENHSLELLSLEWNQLGSSGASFIAHSLEKNSHLEQLDLRNNGIGDEGAVAFGQSLLSNESLRVLDLRWNQISDEGAYAFEKVLLERKTPLSILLAGNLVSHKVIGLVEKWSQHYKVHLSQQPVEEEEEPQERGIIHVDEYEVKYKELLKEYNQIKHQNNTLSSQNADMRRQLDSSAITVTDLEQKVIREEFCNEQLEEKLRLSQQKLSELTHEFSAANSNWEMQRAEVAETHKRSIADFTTEIAGHVNEKESLKERLRKTKESLENMEIQSDRLQRQAKEEIAELQEDLRRAVDRATESAVLQSKAEGEANMATAKLLRNSDRIKSLESELQAAKAHAQERLESEQRLYQDEIDQLRHRMAENAKDASDKIVKLTDELNSLRSQYTEAESEISSLKVTLKQSCDEAASAAQKDEREHCSQIIERLKIQLNAVATEKQNALNKYVATTEELKEVRQNHNAEIRSVNDTLTERREECECLRESTIHLNSKISQLEAEKHASAAEIDALRTKVADIDGREAKLQDELHRVSRERDALLGTVQTLKKEARMEAVRQKEDFGELSQRLTALMTRELESAKPKFAKEGI